MKSSTRLGQSQLLIPVIVILTSVLAIATNTYINSTNSSSPTGSFLGVDLAEGNDFSIDVWANTSVMLNSGNDTIKAQLFMDNGTALTKQEIRFYVNGTLKSRITDSEGYAYVNFTEGDSVIAVFEGNASEFLSPSQSALESSVIQPVIELTKEESITPEGKVIKINNKGNASIIVETEIEGSDALGIHSKKRSFSSSENPEFDFTAGVSLRLILIEGNKDVTDDPEYNVHISNTGNGKKMTWSVNESSNQSFLIKKESKSIKSLNAYVEGSCCNLNISAEVEKKGKDYRIKVSGNRSFKPGSYKLVVEFDGSMEEYWFT
ncbi:MAG: hypothetical protein V1850_03765, partial [Candidatus Bathyarchaeota archaeon]